MYPLLDYNISCGLTLQIRQVVNENERTKRDREREMENGRRRRKDIKESEWKTTKMKIGSKKRVEKVRRVIKKSRTYSQTQPEMIS